MGKEIWKSIIGYENTYEVSTSGRVKSLQRTSNGHGCSLRIIYESIRNGSLNHNGYLDVCLSKNKKGKVCQVHRLVAIAFIPNPENKPCTNHKNGIKTDNRAVNLEWVTESENQKHAYKTGLRIPKCGENHHRTKLSNAETIEIKGLCVYFDSKELAEMYNTTKQIVNNIKYGYRKLYPPTQKTIVNTSK